MTPAEVAGVVEGLMKCVRCPAWPGLTVSFSSHQ